MGVDYAKLDEATEGDGRRLREGLGIASDAFVLFYTAEFSPRKSQQVLIRAIRDLPKSVVLVLCGDGTKREECRALSRELGVSDRVLFSGQVENISIWYRMADACVSSSRSEGLQFNIMEAMHLGLPVIASDVKGDADLIEDGVNGLLYPYGDARACAGCISCLMGNAALREQMTKKADRASNHMRWLLFSR